MASRAIALPATGRHWSSVGMMLRQRLQEVNMHAHVSRAPAKKRFVLGHARCWQACSKTRAVRCGVCVVLAART